MWNELQKVVVEVDTIATLKKHLDRYMGRIGLEEYGQNAGR